MSKKMLLVVISILAIVSVLVACAPLPPPHRVPRAQ